MSRRDSSLFDENNVTFDVLALQTPRSSGVFPLLFFFGWFRSNDSTLQKLVSLTADLRIIASPVHDANAAFRCYSTVRRLKSTGTWIIKSELD